MPLTPETPRKECALLSLLLLLILGVGKWAGAYALYTGTGTLNVGRNTQSLLRPDPAFTFGRTRHSNLIDERKRLRTNPSRTNIVLFSTSSISSQPISNSTTSSAIDSSTSSSSFLQQPKATPTSPELYSVDVRYNRRSPLIYDASTGRYLDASVTETSSSLTPTLAINHDQEYYTLYQKCCQFLHSAFVPEGVSESYFNYVRWRILQRFVNANVHVIGTQSLLMGLRGMQRTRISDGVGGGSAVLGAAAATNWVLKDTLGKVVRMAWASKMGRKFDPDAKRWRFRASLIYALGNGLEVSTYLHPQYFLVLAMLANSCKQMSMLTSSATRNALYNSFRRVDVVSSPSTGVTVVGGNTTNSNAGNRRGSGGVENIGDITAKGEAQIAVVDLLGIVSGICLSSEYAFIDDKVSVPATFDPISFSLFNHPKS